MSDLQPLNRQTTSAHSAYPERVVQFGAGNFIRAFADWMIQILNEQTDFSGGVVVVKATPGSRYDDLDAQEGLFHVQTEGLEHGDFVSRTTLIDCVQRTVYPYYDYEAYRQLARQPELQVITSNTTEAGISYEEDDKFTDKPASSFPGKLTQFLYERYQYFDGAADKGLIILPTELVVDNGSQLRDMILRYANQWSLGGHFNDWIQQHNIFCNTLVDRIVPGYPADKAEAIRQSIGYEDNLLVMGEPYHSFVVEAPWPIQQTLPFHETALNVQIVDNIMPYRQRKVRILNGLHTSMVPIGYFLGLESVRECINHPALAQCLMDEAHHEIIPSLNLPDDETGEFTQDVIERFRNPAIHHRLLSIATNHSTKVRTRLLPTLFLYREIFHTLPLRVVLAMAAFIRFYKGEWHGENIPLNDDETVINWFRDCWTSSATTADVVQQVLMNKALWHMDLSQIEGLQTQLVDYLNTIETSGIQSVINDING